MKNFKYLLISLYLSTTSIITTQATETTVTAPKQVTGHYHHQIDNPQITALLDSTNYLNACTFKA